MSSRPAWPGFPPTGEVLGGCVISFARLSWSESGIGSAGQLPVSGERVGQMGGAGEPSTSGPLLPVNKESWRLLSLEKKLQERQNLPTLVSVGLQGESGCCLGNRAGGPEPGLGLLWAPCLGDGGSPRNGTR